MIRRPLPLTALALALQAVAAAAQPPLTLEEAVARAARHAEARIAESVAKEAAERVRQARARYFPTVDLTEGWQRGTQPVYVFGSLLAQRRFTADDFAIDALNRPDALDNFRAAVSVEQPVFDPATRARVRAAELGHDLATTGRARAAQALTLATTAAYVRLLVAEATDRTAAAAMTAADADRTRARDRRDAGLVTEADVLAVEVHLARMREAQIQAAADVRIARARLNELMQAPLDQAFVLAPMSSAAEVAADPAALEREALDRRPELRAARLDVELGAVGERLAKAAFLPQVAVQGLWEINGHRWTAREGSWIAGATVRLNVFNGQADRARVAEAALAHDRRKVERERLESAVRLEVQAAAARLESARARQALGQTVVAQATEALRIVRDRYEQGLADVTALLRAAEALRSAEALQIGAQGDLLVARAAVARAVGRE